MAVADGVRSHARETFQWQAWRSAQRTSPLQKQPDQCELELGSRRSWCTARLNDQRARVHDSCRQRGSEKPSKSDYIPAREEEFHG